MRGEVLKGIEASRGPKVIPGWCETPLPTVGFWDKVQEFPHGSAISAWIVTIHFTVIPCAACLVLILLHFPGEEEQ